MSGVRLAVASVLPWEDDEGIQTLLSLSLGSHCRPQMQVVWLGRAPCYLISGLLLPRTRTRVTPPSPGVLLTRFSLPVRTLSAQGLTLTDSKLG